jgi:glycosyltransferase involved in cell wall biosynthesis
MSRLRFCMITTFYPPYNFGGDGIGIERLSAALVRRGHEVTVIHDIDAFNLLHDGPEPAPALASDGVEVIGLRSGLRSLSPLLTQQTGRPIVQAGRIREVLNRGFDVTMFHNVSLIGGPGILNAGRGITLYEAHEHWLVCASHVLWRHGRELCTGRQCVRCAIHHRRPPQIWRHTGFLERQLAGVDAFIAKSEFSRAKHHEFGFGRDMEVIPYFLPDADSPAGAEIHASPHPRPYFLFVGRLEQIKGLDDVIPVFAGEEGPDLLIVGDGSYASTLRQLAAGLPRVRFTGRLSQAELKALYRHALALVVPSVCYETFGIILIEAFRHGTPVVARRIGPFPEIVEACGGGLLFDGPADLRLALQQLERSDERRSALGMAAFGGFQRFWSETAVVPRYLELIERLRVRRRTNSALALA